MQTSHSDKSPVHGGYYEPPTQLSQSSPRSNETQKNGGYNVDRMHGGYYEPPTQRSQPTPQSTNTQKSDAYHVHRMHGGIHEPCQPQQQGSSHPSEYPSRATVFPRMIQGEGHEAREGSTSSHRNCSESHERLLDDPSISQPVQSGTSDNHKVWHASFSLRTRLTCTTAWQLHTIKAVAASFYPTSSNHLELSACTSLC